MMVKNKIKKKRLLFIPVIAALILLIVSCNDEPTFMGSSLLLDTISIKSLSSDDTAIFVDSKSFLSRIEIFNIGTMFVGKSNEVTAISMIRFSGIPDSLDKLTDTDIESVTLTLPLLRYTYGDSSNPNALSFKIYKIVKFWTNQSNWDTLFQSGSQTTDYFDYSQVLGTFNGAIDEKDTTWEPISIQLDKKLIIDWFKLAADTLTDETIWGISLVPDDNSTVIHTFSSQTLSDNRVHPYISVIYKKTLDTLDTLILSSAIDASITNSNQPDENSLTIQGGISGRFKISFDISAIPDEAAIHVAQLDLYLDKSLCSNGNFDIDSNLAARLYTDSTYTSYFREYTAGKDLKNKELFKFPEITSAVQYWLSHGKKGELVFSPQDLDNEYREFDKLVFHSLNDTEPSKRPALRIIYSTRPKIKFNP